MAHIMIGGREGVARDGNGAFELVEEGARLGATTVKASWLFATGLPARIHDA